MLERLTFITNDTARQAPVRPVRIIRAVSIARRRSADYAPWERGRDAAAWLDGRAIVQPTMTLATTVFNVSRPLIEAARKDRGVVPVPFALGCLAFGWANASPAERVEFVRTVEETVWTALQHVTDPPV